VNLKDLESQGLIEKVKVTERQIWLHLTRAEKDLATAEANLDIDEEWAFTIAYHAMLRAGRALMLLEGYRLKGRDQHKTIVVFCAAILGEQYKQLVNRFNRMRVKRHHFIYEPEKPISKTEAIGSIQSARELVEKIKEVLKAESPQKRLFDD